MYIYNSDKNKKTSRFYNNRKVFEKLKRFCKKEFLIKYIIFKKYLNKQLNYILNN